MEAVRGGTLLDSAPLRPFRAALNRVLPGFGADESVDFVVDPTVVLGEGVLRLLQSVGGSGVVLLLEDLHWADPDTVALLDYLAGALTTSPVVAVATVRDDSPGSSIAGSLSRIPGAIHLRLGPLSYAEAAILIEERSDLNDPQRQLLIKRADGVPLLIEELLAAVTDSAGFAPDIVPESFAEAIAARLRRLTAEQRRVLIAAALLGAEPDWSLAAATTDLDEASVLSAARAVVAAHLLVVEQDRLRWRHAVTREAVLARLLPPERSVLATRAAKALQSSGGDDEESAAADLLTAAGDHDAAAAIRLRQVARDIKKGAMRSAEQQLDRLARADSPPLPVALERVRLHTLIGDAARALQAGVTALELATGEDHAELCLRLARAGIIARHWDEAEGYVARAGRPEGPRSSVLLAEAAHGAGRIDVAVAYANRAVEQSETDQTPEALCEALCIVGRLARLSDPAAAAAAFRRAGQIAAEFGLRPWQVEAELGLGTAESLDRERSPALIKARDLALDSGLLIQAGGAQVILAEQAYVAEGPRALEARHNRSSSSGALCNRRISSASASCCSLRATRYPDESGRWQPPCPLWRQGQPWRRIPWPRSGRSEPCRVC